MDARPYRPRGSENVAPPLHQRHKSTGNLASMAAASAASNASVTAGFRGPAKRAAFGDVTNMTKNATIGNGDAKVVKLQSVTTTSNNNNNARQPNAWVNKENNVPYSKDSLARGAQRTNVLAASKPKTTVTAVPAPDAAKKYSVGVSRPKTAGESDLDAILPSVSRAAFEAPALQPRHHKSQPQLSKLQQQQQQQHVLRRTQSKQFERVDLTSDSSIRLSSDLVGIPSQILEENLISEHEAYLDLPPYASDVPHPLPQVNHTDEYADLPLKLAHFSEEPQLVHPSIPAAKENHTQALSEAEEYWDEEEEEYEDQDQAYTTAHSFRSRDLTTGGVTTLIAPRLTSKVQRELDEARLEVQQTRLMDDVEEEMWDVSMVAEYGEEIFEYMRELEVRMQPNPHYMESQTEIQWSMRSVLMDWLVQVHNRFSLLPETLFLTVNYIDRFLSCKIVSIGKLQLVGATAILVASKYEEINCPSLDEIVYMVDGGYTTEEILKAERFMLSMLNFELGWPGPMSFLRRVSKADDYDLDTRTLAKYFLELTIMDERFVASPPSFLAAGAHCLSRLILNKGDWSKAHIHYSGYTWSQLRPLVTMMLECCEQPRLHHAAIFEKYQEKRFKEASTVVQHALDSGFTLPHQGVSGRSTRAQTDDLSDALQYANSLLVSTEG